MIVVSATYPFSKTNKFDESYYHANHIPLVKDALGELLKDVVLFKGLPGLDGSDPAFFYRADLVFESMEDLGKAFTGPRVGEMMADTANYTDVTNIITVSEK